MPWRMSRTVLMAVGLKAHEPGRCARPAAVVGEQEDVGHGAWKHRSYGMSPQPCSCRARHARIGRTGTVGDEDGGLEGEMRAATPESAAHAEITSRPERDADRSQHGCGRVREDAWLRAGGKPGRE